MSRAIVSSFILKERRNEEIRKRKEEKEKELKSLNEKELKQLDIDMLKKQIKNVEYDLNNNFKDSISCINKLNNLKNQLNKLETEYNNG